jgi:hypothetical protein
MKEYDINKQIPRFSMRAEILATWYMRFNGFFVVPNFIIHDAGLFKQVGGQLSEADLLAIRMPYEHERIRGKDFEIFVQNHSPLDLSNKLEFVIAEISSKKCKFNWFNNETKTINENFIIYALNRIGWWPDTGQISKELSEKFQFESKNESTKIVERIRLLSFGNSFNSEIKEILQITFRDVLQYMKEDLFMCYRVNEDLKKVVSDHKQWNQMICQVYNKLLGHKTSEHSVDDVLNWLFPDSDHG